ncbi:Z1 domain-containing protein [Brevibacterium sp. FAM 24630]|uniref:Z1 domain-containing protein n=1 Tax=unclassified Brevibacterium TaxID=2614124 RepID=UPI003C7D9C93
MTKEPSPVEIIFNSFLQKMSREDARKKTKVSLEALPGIEDELDALEREHKEEVLTRTKLTEVGTARRRDLREIGWYSGAPDDGLWAELRERMLTGGLAGAVESIDRSTEEIVASLAEPRVEKDSRLGLVIGNVQSGKTANYSAVIAKALDSGYKFVLVLSGVHNNLRKQTQVRLDRDLGVFEDRQSWYRLTDPDGDFGDAHTGNASSIVANHGRVLAVVKKNSHRLRKVLEFLASLDESTKRDTPFLVIDDESDQATPDASAKIGDEPTAINRLMRQIWGEVRNGTYVGYTATPFANVFMDPNVPETSLQELYPRDFIHVMPTPSNYFGAERIFGLHDVADEERDAELPDVVRAISREEVRELVPSGRNIEGFRPNVTKSLGEAIRWFIVACAVRRVRGQQKKHSTMLVHTTPRTDPHFATRDAVEEFLAPLRRASLNGDVEGFKEVFENEINRAAWLYDGDGLAPTWPRVSDEIPNVLRYLQTVVDNGREEDSERLSYSHEPQTVIVIGGSTLSRGLTLEGLFVSYFTRTSNTYDTLLQMGRWFGYRAGYEDLQRIWVSPRLDEDYRFLATVEADLRSEIARMTQAGMTPAEIGVRVRLHPGRLQVTSSAKQKHALEAEVDFEGYRLQTTLFDFSSNDAALANVKLTENLLRQIQPFRSQEAPTLFEDVPLEELRPFFEEFEIHENYRNVFSDAIKWSSEKLPDKRWNVVVPSEGRGDERLKVGEQVVGSIRRAPIGTETETLKSTKEINIRALMSGRDVILDLRLQGRLPQNKTLAQLNNEAQYDWRKNRAGGDGRGLLVLYPISRHSATSSADRMSMDSALRAIDPVLVEEGQPPILGMALVAPFDSEERLQSKGSTIAVRPIFDDAEDFDEPIASDTERDYRGDS